MSRNSPIPHSTSWKRLSLYLLKHFLVQFAFVILSIYSLQPSGICLRKTQLFGAALLFVFLGVGIHY